MRWLPMYQLRSLDLKDIFCDIGFGDHEVEGGAGWPPFLHLFMIATVVALLAFRLGPCHPSGSRQEFWLRASVSVGPAEASLQTKPANGLGSSWSFAPQKKMSSHGLKATTLVDASRLTQTWSYQVRPIRSGHIQEATGHYCKKWTEVWCQGHIWASHHRKHGLFGEPQMQEMFASLGHVQLVAACWKIGACSSTGQCCIPIWQCLFISSHSTRAKLPYGQAVSFLVFALMGTPQHIHIRWNLVLKLQRLSVSFCGWDLEYLSHSCLNNPKPLALSPFQLQIGNVLVKFPQKIALAPSHDRRASRSFVLSTFSFDSCTQRQSIQSRTEHRTDRCYRWQ